MKNQVAFRSTAFNIAEPQPYFINECCFGDDVCRWLIAELRARGVQTDSEPGQEDFGWYFCFTVAGNQFCFVTSFQPNDLASGNQWLGWVERDRGFLASIFAGRDRDVDPTAIQVIDEVLRSSPKVAAVEWGDRTEA